MKLKSCLLLIPVLFYSAIAFSQNSIVGTWEGKFLSQDFELGQPKLVVEIYDFKGSSFTGVSHLYYRENKYEHYRIVGLYDEKDSVLAFKEVSTIAVDLGTYGNCLGTYMMSLKKADGYLVQNGFWEATIRGCTSNSNIWLQKKIEEIKKPEPKIKPAPTKPIPNKPVVKNKPPVIVQPARDRITTPVIAIPPATPPVKNIPVVKPPAVLPAKVTQRETDVQSLLEISSAEKDSIKVEVYDNGEIDGDSVSVYEDGVLRINKKLITASPITFYISLSKNVNPIAHLRLVAESLGSIPPCTALMIVTTRSKRYEVHLSSNFNKNATVELFLKE